MLLKKYKLKVKRELIKHPEQKDDEIFIGNGNEYSFKQIGWKTKRKGNKAYSLLPFLKTGELVLVKNLFPVFIKKDEYISYRDGKFLQGKEKT